MIERNGIAEGLCSMHSATMMAFCQHCFQNLLLWRVRYGAGYNITLCEDCFVVRELVWCEMYDIHIYHSTGRLLHEKSTKSIITCGGNISEKTEDESRPGR